MIQQKVRFRYRSTTGSLRPLAGIVIAGVMSLPANPLWAQEKDHKDTSKDKELSVTVQGP